MKTARKVLIIALCAVLLVSASVMGTLAYLTSEDSVTNTFTVGNVKITLDELDVDNSTPGENDRDKANSYKLIPGSTYTKDPTVHVDANSENAWLFVKVENGISEIEADTNTIATQMTTNGWTLVEGETNVYAYKEIVEAGKDYIVFNSFTVAGDAEVADYTDDEINVTAYAIQAENFETSAAAWAAYKTQNV